MLVNMWMLVVLVAASLCWARACSEHALHELGAESGECIERARVGNDPPPPPPKLQLGHALTLDF